MRGHAIDRNPACGLAAKFTTPCALIRKRELWTVLLHAREPHQIPENPPHLAGRASRLSRRLLRQHRLPFSATRDDAAALAGRLYELGPRGTRRLHAESDDRLSAARAD